MRGLKGVPVNVHEIDRRILLTHLRAIEERLPLRFVGLLAPGSATHVFGDDAVNFLAEGQPNASLLDVAQAEVELSERLGRPVAIILRSELHGADAQRILAGLQTV
jgi:hypothetical protein